MEFDRSRCRRLVISFGLLLVLSLALLGCEGEPTEIDACVDIAAFQAAAREASCAELRNKLFMIDRHLVFWDTESDCADAYWYKALYGCTLDDQLCCYRSTVAGARWEYTDSSYQFLFETIVTNHLQRDLGLGPYHEVLPIPF